MKKSFIAFGAVVLIACSAVFFSSSGCSSENFNTNDSTVTSPAPTAGINSSYSVLPSDIDRMSQATADTFSWLTFIAVNWPADTMSCTADTSNGKSILTGNGPRVWETYLTSDQVFVAQGKQPSQWCANNNMETAVQHLPEKVQLLARKTGVKRFLHMNAKSPTIHGVDQASGGPLVDQNGRFARYEIHVNQDEYNYITQKSLWNKQGQQKFLTAGDTVYFPNGPTQYGSAGAMEVKAAWKVLGAGDDSTRFYTIRAIVYNDNSGDDPSTVTLGLVGLHIAHKTKTQFMWVWSTFEHVDNLTRSFYNPNCPACPVNQPITGSEDELDPKTGKPLHAPTQVTRVNDVGLPDVAGINTYFHGLLKNTVWANYDLIGTQWLFFENVTPDFLANSVQETYLQGPHPDSIGYKDTSHSTDKYYFKDPQYKPFSPYTSSSCVGCHYTANLAVSGKHPEADFSFLLGDAQ